MMIVKLTATVAGLIALLFVLASTVLAISEARTLALPPAALGSSVISLPSAVDPGTGKVVEGLAIIHRRGEARNASNNNSRSTTCYSYLSKGAKWKTVEHWVTNTTNTRGLNGSTVFNLLSGGISKWEDATDGVVGNGLGVDVLGSGATTSATLVADTVAPDNQNEVYFANISDPGVIAVTIIWGIFGGPPFGRELVEWDQVYDDVSFDWSAQASGVLGKMDFDNIATHELGHSVGMGDLYNTCIDETMYGFSSNGETKKRDLNSGDITGVNALY